MQLAANHTSQLFSARNIKHSFGKRQVLLGVDIEVNSGEVVALLGTSGAGKSTLLKIIAGLLKPQHGSLTYTSERIGVVPQKGGAHGRLTVKENIELFTKLQKLPKTDIDAAIERAYLEPWASTPAEQLSGGLRQRLNVVLGTLGNPPLLLLDEPTTGIDIAHKALLTSLLREFAQNSRGVLHTTHDISDAKNADRVVVLAHGRIVWNGLIEGIANLAKDVTLSSQYDELTDPIVRGLLRVWNVPSHTGVSV